MLPSPRLPSRPHRALPWLVIVFAITAILAGSAARGQGIDPQGRPIAKVELQGLEAVPEKLVRNQLRSQAGDPYDAKVVQQDIVRLTHLGRFAQVGAQVQPNRDGSVTLTYNLTEQPLLADVQVVGNKALGDQALRGDVGLGPGDPVDPFLISRGKQRIVKAYEQAGYFVADVSVDQELLDKQHVLIYKVREGPKVRIAAFRFKGNKAFSDKQLRSQVHSRTYFPILRSGDLSREQLEIDAAHIRDYYTQRGYLDAQVGRRIELSPNQREAVVVFLISQGPQYTVGNVRVSGADLFPDDQIRLAMKLTRGATYSSEQRDASRQAVQALYGKLGYLRTQVQINPLFDRDSNTVDLSVSITEGRPYTVGKVTVTGNDQTQSKVILRQVRGMTPGRPYDRTGVAKTRRRLNQSPLFSEATVTILGEDDDPVRDALIQVKEQQTGSLSFGAGVSSDAGVLGAINLSQSNFDILDFPQSTGDLFSGQAFHGAGQQFNLSLQPGARTSRYAVNFTEPYLLESDYSLSSNAFYFNRDRENYLEERVGGGFGFGHRFGDVWSGAINFRGVQVDIADIDPSAPVDVFDVKGHSLLTSVGLSATRSTVDSRIFPTQGSQFTVSLERDGALGGDYNFTKLQAQYHKFWTVDEDFLGRRSVLSFRGEVGYLFEDDQAPVFERLYAGGHASFRGFDYRGIGPRGIENNTGQIGDDPVGGQFLLLTSVQYNMPLIEDYLRLVFFTDQGTVQNDIGVDKWRASIGTGLRIKLPVFGSAPFALDFAYPLLKEDGDETRVFSFDVSVPLR